MFAKRYEQKIKASFLKDINAYQSQLDILKQTTLRYYDKQFELYSILCSSLHDLKVLADDLWVEANYRNMEKFVKQLKKTKDEIEKASLLLRIHIMKGSLIHRNSLANIRLVKDYLLIIEDKTIGLFNLDEKKPASNLTYRFLMFFRF